MTKSSSALAVVFLLLLWAFRHLGLLLLVPVAVYLAWEYGTVGPVALALMVFTLRVLRSARTQWAE